MTMVKRERTTYKRPSEANRKLLYLKEKARHDLSYLCGIWNCSESEAVTRALADTRFVVYEEIVKRSKR